MLSERKLTHYRDNILCVCQAALKSWSEYTTDEIKLEKLIKYNFE